MNDEERNIEDKQVLGGVEDKKEYCKYVHIKIEEELTW